MRHFLILHLLHTTGVYGWSTVVVNYPKQLTTFCNDRESDGKFLKFHDIEENSVYSNDDLLPERQLLRIYCKENDIGIITTVPFGVTSIHITMAEIDSLCDWINETIVNL